MWGLAPVWGHLCVAMWALALPHVVPERLVEGAVSYSMTQEGLRTKWPKGAQHLVPNPKLIGKYPHSTFVFHGILTLAKETSWGRSCVRREVSFSLYV